VFPSLLSRLLEKNYSACIRSGFEGTGLYPVNVERATSKLPAEGEAPQDAEQHAPQSASQQACPEAQAEG